jgi:uncharacterized protein (DUF433 family)
MRRRRKQAADPREQPAYTIAEAAHYLDLPVPTIRYWATGSTNCDPLVDVPARHPVLLSFLNLAELHVLAAIRREHAISMPKVRTALAYLAQHTRRDPDRRHPLISADLETDGLDLFIDEYGRLINISREGQTVIREVVRAALSRVERGPEGIPVKLYPFTRKAIEDAPAMIVIDPRLSAGRPVIAGTGLATQVIAERYKAGESVRELAYDYGRERAEIEEAIRCEVPLAA